MDHKPIGSVSVYRSQSQMPMVKAMTITVDSLLPRPKLDYDVCYDAAVKGASVVVCQVLKWTNGVHTHTLLHPWGHHTKGGGPTPQWHSGRCPYHAAQ
jgi:hypothetical protein